MHSPGVKVAQEEMTKGSTLSMGNSLAFAAVALPIGVAEAAGTSAADC